MDNNIKEAQYTWDTIDIKKVRDVSWLSYSCFKSNLEKNIKGRDGLTYESIILQQYGISERNKLKGLALVCGDMTGESTFFKNTDNISFTRVDGYDLSSESLNRFKSNEFNFVPHVSNVNDILLPENEYDLVVGLHGIHHVYNLGGLFYQTHKSIKETGILIIHEWIGPAYLQIPITNHVLSTLLLLILFPCRKTRRTHDGRVKGVFIQYLPESFDPSEACNSTMLLPQLLQYFQPIRSYKYGGLTYPMFEGLGGNLNEYTRVNRFKLRLVLMIESGLTKIGVIKPLFISGYFRKRNDISNRRASIINMMLNRIRKIVKYR